MAVIFLDIIYLIDLEYIDYCDIIYSSLLWVSSDSFS